MEWRRKRSSLASRRVLQLRKRRMALFDTQGKTGKRDPGEGQRRTKFATTGAAAAVTTSL